jgi:hypothetical protein
MNVVNRLIVVLGIVVVVLFAALVIVLAWAYSSETIGKLGDFVTYLNDRETNGTRVIITLAGGFIILVGLSLFVLELAPRRQKTVLVRDVETGNAVLSTYAVARRLEDVVTGLPDVEVVRAKVAGKNKAVEVDLQVMVNPECDLSAVASEVSRMTQEVTTEQMSVALARPPRLQLYYSYGSTTVKAHPAPAGAPSGAAEGKRPRSVRVVKEVERGETAKPPEGETPSQPEEAPPESEDKSGES